MRWQFSSYSLALCLTGALLAGLSASAARRREANGATSFARLMIAMSWWAIISGIEAAAMGAEAKFFWTKVQYLSVVSVAPLWLLFALDYTSQNSWLNRRNALVLWLIPALTLLFAWTNELHHLVWTGMTIEPNSNIAVYNHGVWFWVNTSYAYLLLVFGVLALLWALLRFPQIYRAQSATLLAGVAIPWVGNALYLTKKVPFEGFDPTPFSFAFTSALFTFTLFRQHFLDLTPIARETLVEGMNDAVLVVDASGRLVDINPTARQLFGLNGTHLGEATSALWPESSPLLAVLRAARHDTRTRHELISVHPPGETTNHLFDAQITPLTARREKGGQLVVLRDVTQRERAQSELHLAHEQLKAQFAEIAQLQTQLREQANRDALTGLYNRRFLTETLDQWLVEAQDQEEPLVVVMIDIDHFKAVNDTFGHATGDTILRCLSDFLRGTNGEDGLACRFGGEEFVVVLRRTSLADARIRAEQWRETFAEYAVQCGPPGLHATVSMGLAAFPQHGRTLDALLHHADEALYAAKSAGRDRICD